MRGSNVWVDDPGQDMSGPTIPAGWFPVVAEDRGGVVAYFGSEEDAKMFREAYLNRGEYAP